MKLDKEQYLQLFNQDINIDKTSSTQQKALERAWKNRDFEIELYWKRATYFWAFIGATFAGYFIVLDYSESYLRLVLAIMGFIFSLAWFLVNKGSKKWQENWEKHIDMLEDEITGPIYKTVLNRDAPSVSGVNMKVSLFVTVLWMFFIFQYFFDYIVDFPNQEIIYNVLLIVIMLFFVLNLLNGHIKPNVFNKKKDQFSFRLRSIKYEEEH